MIERNHLTIMREIYRQGSLTAAANELNLTQSAVSHCIKKLEQQLGTPLWTKKGRNLQLTRAGEHLLGVANRLLPQLERSDENLQNFARGHQGTLRIGMECYPCYRWLLKVIHRFMAIKPNVELDVKQKFVFGGMAALFNHDIDILVTPDPLYKKGISFLSVFDYEQVLVVPKGHTLADKSIIVPKDLSSEVLYTYPVEKQRLDIFSAFLTPAQVEPRKHQTVEATEIILQLVENGRGVTTLPGWLAEEYSGTHAIETIRLGQKGIQKHIHLGIRQQEEEEPIVSAFLGLARQNIQTIATAMVNK